MTRRLVIRPAAEEDLDRYFLYIARDSPGMALRFLDSARETFEKIAAWPHTGARRDMMNPALHGLWSRPIDGFPNHLAFYRLPDERTVRIVRVLHGAMDLDPILETEA